MSTLGKPGTPGPVMTHSMPPTFADVVASLWAGEEELLVSQVMFSALGKASFELMLGSDTSHCMMTKPAVPIYLTGSHRQKCLTFVPPLVVPPGQVLSVRGDNLYHDRQSLNVAIRYTGKAIASS